MDIRPVRQPPLGEQLIQQLRALIVRGDLAPGTHLVEGWIAEQFGVSRGPVRDALRQLVLEGLVDTRRRGVFVRGLGEQDLRELYAVRGALEGLAVRSTVELAASGSVASWGPVDDAVARMQRAAGDQDAATFAAADLDFHNAFYLLGGNTRLAAAWSTYADLFAAMLGVTNTRYRDLGPVARDHAGLAATIRFGDLDAALRSLQEHLDGSLDRMLGVLAEHRSAS